MVDSDNDFCSLAKLKKYKVLEATREDRRVYISHRLKGIAKGSGKEVVFTVFLRRQNNPSKYSDNWGWVEFRRRKGSPGWLYGNANFIAFETSKSYIIVASKILIEWLNASPKVRYDLPFVTEAKNARYKILRDKNGRESTQVNFRDIKKLNGTQVWKKEL